VTSGPVSVGPQNSPGYLLWRTTLRWQRSIAGSLRPLELTHVQFVLLASVWWLTEYADVPPSQRQVADHAGVDVMMTSQVLRALATRALVTRTADPVDTRVKRLTVTAAGRRLAQQAVTVVEAADAAFFAGLSDQPALLAILRELSG